MKKIFTKTILFVLLGSPIIAQTEQANHEKYWNFRDNLKRRSLKIGSLDDIGSLIYGTSIPSENRDNVNTGCGGTGKRMRWGDATIHQPPWQTNTPAFWNVVLRGYADTLAACVGPKFRPRIAKTEPWAMEPLGRP